MAILIQLDLKLSNYLPAYILYAVCDFNISKSSFKYKLPFRGPLETTPTSRRSKRVAASVSWAERGPPDLVVVAPAAIAVVTVTTTTASL